MVITVFNKNYFYAHTYFEKVINYYSRPITRLFIQLWIDGHQSQKKQFSTSCKIDYRWVSNDLAELPEIYTLRCYSHTNDNRPKSSINDFLLRSFTICFFFFFWKTQGQNINKPRMLNVTVICYITKKKITGRVIKWPMTKKKE